MDQPTTCPKCSGPMERGFLCDTGEHRLRKRVQRWIRGIPERAFFVGVKSKTEHPSSWFYIRSDRCMQCGYLESFAIESKTPLF